MKHPVRFYPYTQITEIGLLIKLLEDNGIAAFPEENGGPGLDPFMAQSIQGKWLWVNESDLERAREVLLELKPEFGKSQEPKSAIPGYVQVEGWCPNCESSFIFEKKGKGWFGLLESFLPFYSKKRARFCGKCGFQWT